MQVRIREIPEDESTIYYILEGYDPRIKGWTALNASYDLERVQKLSEAYSTDVTEIAGTDNEYLGTHSTTLALLGPNLDAINLRLKLIHEFSHCSCEHDCCGHVCGANFEIKAAFFQPDGKVLVLAHSEFTYNV